MNQQQYEEETKRRAELNAKQLGMRDTILRLEGELAAVRQQRAGVKSQVAEIDVRLQEYERDNRVARKPPKRERPRQAVTPLPVAAEAAPEKPWWKFWKR